MHKEAVHVTLENSVLTVRGERLKFEATVNRESYHRVERKYGQFIRIFTLPTFVEGNKVVAEFGGNAHSNDAEKRSGDTQADRSDEDLIPQK